MKRIVICCDGTWNKPGQIDGGKEVRTNVQKIGSLVLPNDKTGIEQVVIYHTGVGTQNSLYDKIFGGGFGAGLNRNIKEVYAKLAEIYKPGDELYLTGFSRGAYTARSVVGFIRNCGIIKEFDRAVIRAAFDKYRDRTEDASPDSDEMSAFREEFSYPLERIKFIGVWDTVGALGVPLRWFEKFNMLTLNTRFHDCTLTSWVEHAYHALAIDEKRAIFKANLWNQSSAANKEPGTEQVLEQVWFPGVHSNVGGGYPDEGLSDISLKWMIEKAKACGLCFDEEMIAQIVNPSVTATLYESWSSFFKITPAYHRPVYKGRNTLEQVHPAAVTLFETNEKYRPPALLYAFSRDVPLYEI